MLVKKVIGGVQMIFKSTRRYENDCREWVKDNDLEIRYSSEIFPEASIYVIKHWLYCCASTPAIEMFLEKDWLEGYITKNVKAGDLLEIWALQEDKMRYAWGKMPDENGLVPLKGAY